MYLYCKPVQFQTAEGCRQQRETPLRDCFFRTCAATIMLDSISAASPQDYVWRRPSTGNTGPGNGRDCSGRNPAALEQVLASTEFRATAAARIPPFCSRYNACRQRADAEGADYRGRGFRRAAAYDRQRLDGAGEGRRGAQAPPHVLHRSRRRQSGAHRLPAGGYVPEFHRAPVPPPDQGVAVAPAAPAGHVWLCRLRPCVRSWPSHWPPSSSRRARRQRPTRCCASSGPALDSSNACCSASPMSGLRSRPSRREWRTGPRRVEDFTLLPENYVGAATCRRLLAFAAVCRHEPRLPNEAWQRRLIPRSELIAAVLIGYSYTRWSTLLRGFRYLFDTNPQTPRVTDNGKPTAWLCRDTPQSPHG